MRAVPLLAVFVFAMATSPAIALPEPLPKATTVILEGTFFLVEELLTETAGWSYGLVKQADGTSPAIDPPSSASLMRQFDQLQTGDHVRLEVAKATGPRVVVGTTGEEHKLTRSRYELVAVLSVEKSKNKAVKAAPTGTPSLLVLRCYYNNENPDTACTDTCIRDNLWDRPNNNVDDMYNVASNGALRLPKATALVLNVTISKNTVPEGDSCEAPLAGIADDADAAALAQHSVTATDYDMVLYMSPAFCGIGVAFVGGRQAFVDFDGADAVAHELGHNFGFGHSNIDVNDDGITEEAYADRSCTMGYSGVGLRSFNAPALLFMNWLPAATVTEVSSGCYSQSHLTLSPLVEAYTQSPTILKLKRATIGTDYYISFRNVAGYEGNMPSEYQNRVYIHNIGSLGANTRNYIAKLEAGESYIHPSGVLNVSVTAISQANANISVNYCEPATTGIEGTVTCGSSISGSTVGAPNIHGDSSGEHFYSFSAASDSTYFFSTCGSDFAATLEVLRVSDGKSMKYSNGGGSCNPQSELGVELTAGDYVVIVEGSGSAEGNYHLNVTCPVVGGPLQCGQTVSGSTVGSPNSIGDASGEHLYSINVLDDLYWFSTCGSSFDTQVRLLWSDFSIAGGCNDCNAQSCAGGINELLGINLQQGKMYVMVEGVGAAEGNYQLTFECENQSITPSQSPTPSTSPSALPTDPPTVSPTASPSATPSQSPSASPVSGGALASCSGGNKLSLRDIARVGASLGQNAGECLRQ